MKKIINVIIVIIIIFIIIYDFRIKTTKLEDEKIEVTLVKCIDGDTAKINYNGENISIRFLAVNTKEIGENEEPYGKEASEYTCNILKNAKKVEIEFDNSSEKYDKYNRLLGWIFVDDELLQYNLVYNGFAEVKYVYGDYKYISELKKAEEHAKEKKLGIWH